LLLQILRRHVNRLGARPHKHKYVKGKGKQKGQEGQKGQNGPMPSFALLALFASLYQTSKNEPSKDLQRAALRGPKDIPLFPCSEY
jgi:hypothetical protein